MVRRKNLKINNKLRKGKGKNGVRERERERERENERKKERKRKRELRLASGNCKEIQPIHPKGDQCWVFIRRTNVEAETPILWPPNAKS